MSAETWHKGYKEIKNIIHNDIGITKEEILEVFRQVAKDEIHKIVSEKNDFIEKTLQKIIKNEIYNVVNDHNYPKVRKHIWSYTSENSFKDYITGLIKEEITNKFWKQFDVKMDIEKKV